MPARPAAGSAPTAAEGLAAPLYDAGLGLPGDFTEEAKGKSPSFERRADIL
ncbi:hypothetical protein PO124_04495 [Bacillus licheniformis]|nr:hypothetical protein [Bacillus licheniformis]